MTSPSRNTAASRYFKSHFVSGRARRLLAVAELVPATRASGCVHWFS